MNEFLFKISRQKFSNYDNSKAKKKKTDKKINRKNSAWQK